MIHCVLFNVMVKEATPRHAGIYRIATFLREHNWDVEVLDYTHVWSLDELKDFARSRVTADTKFFGFSQMFSVWTPIMESFCLWVKETWPNIRIISGCPAPPSYESKAIEFYISGFGEEAILVLLKYLFSNGERPKFDLNFGNRKVINADKFYPAFPYPNLQITYEARDYIQPEEWIAIETSRGCVFKCDFCSYPSLGVKDDYTRSAEDFKTQVTTAHDSWGITKFNIVDSTFNDKIEKITKYADIVEKLSYKPLFGGFIRADLLISRPQDREELLRMNFVQHFYGIESLNKQTLKSIHKGMPPDKVKEGLVEVRKFFEANSDNYVACISLMLGLPHDTPETLEETIQWIENNWQGKSTSISPLTMWTKEFMNNPSSISLDYTKYGYSELSHDEAVARARETGISFLEESSPVDNFFTHSGITPQSEIIWKNEHMDVFDAHVLWKQYLERLPWVDNHFSLGRRAVAELTVNGEPFVLWYKKKKLGVI